VVPDDGTSYHLWREELADGASTTVYAVRHPPDTRVRVLHFGAEPQRLDVWCVAHGVAAAIVGGFFVRDPYRALGEVWTAGRPAEHEPVAAPFGPQRACVAQDGDGLRLAPREALADRPRGDLLQAGPLLLEGGQIVFDRDADREGFSTGAGQFDSDITDGRHPRAALGVGPEGVWAVACDGRRTHVDAGLTMSELAGVLWRLGAVSAINLDGGGSTTLVHRGHLLNRPYPAQDQPAPATRPVVTALALSRDGAP
jgi:hypothetical protein